MSAHQKWEYRELSLDPGSGQLAELLNDAGREGWEVIWIWGRNLGVTVLMKRPLVAAPPPEPLCEACSQPKSAPIHHRAADHWHEFSWRWPVTDV